MQAEEWSRWKNNRTTRKFFKYVKDFREQIAHEIAAHIAEGIPIPQGDVEKAALRCQIFMDLEELTSDEIALFYREEDDEQTDRD